jgi:regulatory protein YycI of two-component signal transduction system YycFG
VADSAYEYLQREQGQIVRMLERNHSVSSYIQDLMEHLVNYCNHKGIAFEDLHIKDAHVVGEASGQTYLKARIIG